MPMPSLRSQGGNHFTRNQALVAPDGGGEQHVVGRAHADEVIGVHHHGVLRHAFPHAHVASLFPIEVGERRFGSRTVGVHDVAIERVAPEDVGDDFAKSVGVQAFVEVLDGVVDVFFFG